MAPGKIMPSRLPAGYINPTGAQMVLIPGGEFVMGSDAADAGPDEQPLTPVTLSEFYMSRFPVTNAEYEQFDPTHRQKRMEGAGDDHPVVYVSSLEAIKYCQWLCEKHWKNYRLPTEAEWEFAARGIDARKYPWGNHDRRGGFANFADASTAFAWRDSQVNDGYPETSPVGAFPGGASFFGLEDMAGNVWEWCLDFYQPLAGSPKRNPRGVASGSKRVYRGGSWKSRFSNLRATARNSNAVNYSCNDVGFRIVCQCVADDSE
jgi:formylglycine-generating enzyme required for sulfatase activity